MSKKLTVAEVAEETDLPQATVAKVLAGLVSVSERNLAKGYDVTVPGLGKLRAKHVGARTARNPKTGETVQVPATIRVQFTVAGTIKTAVNS